MLKLAALLAAICSPAWAASPEFCTVFAREWTRIHFIHNAEIAKANWPTLEQRERAAAWSAPGRQEWILSRNYSACINASVDVLRLPDNLPESSDEAWLKFLIGTTAEPPDPTVDDEAKVDWCKAEYKTYDPADGTVLRRGYKERVPCPYPGEQADAR